MDLLKLMEERYSVRSFSDKKIEDKEIEAILKAGQVAPTACNYQPIKILVLKSKESLEKWQKCTVCHFNENVVMIVCCEKSKAWTREYDAKDSGYVDASIVTTHMMLEASSLGIGSTWVMHFIPEAVKEEFNIPDNLEAVSALTLGYASDQAKPSPRHSARKDLSEIVCYDSFS